MAISESKKKIVIDNYFGSECDMNTTLKEAFTKGFELGLKKAPTPQPKMGKWNFTKHYGKDYYVCPICGMERMDDHSRGWNYCPNCGSYNGGDADASDY